MPVLTRLAIQCFIQQRALKCRFLGGTVSRVKTHRTHHSLKRSCRLKAITMLSTPTSYPPPPAGLNYLAVIRPSLKLLILCSAWSSVLIPLLFPLVLFSSYASAIFLYRLRQNRHVDCRIEQPSSIITRRHVHHHNQHSFRNHCRIACHRLICRWKMVGEAAGDECLGTSGSSSHYGKSHIHQDTGFISRR
ncbi:hypothetical protein DFS33DRAFT_403874 [Desarmillaria ectypa]|nr:hypothetical protein DFS33DRAFT_403874 [Desarmillaria ectypa]